jgi:DNA-binding response OmpR family regulator
VSSVLVVDDDPLVLKTLAEGLSRAGHEVRTALDGEKALQELKSFDAEVLVLDILMPVKDGIETILALAQAPRRPTIIAISGADMRLGMNVLGIAKKLGADYTLKKPFSPKQLADLVRHASSSP